jgi:hypothetical protein
VSPVSWSNVDISNVNQLHDKRDAYITQNIEKEKSFLTNRRKQKMKQNKDKEAEELYKRMIDAKVLSLSFC